jgi:predicted RNA-binding Zn-ribbon protein involved in translation (DUF1610 family)
MKICAFCRKEISVDKYFSRKSVCPECGADLHICLNCKFFSEKSHNKCLEPKAEYQRTRDKANFCDYFIYKETDKIVFSNKKEDAFKKLEELFKKK